MNSLNQNIKSKVNLFVNSVTEILKDLASRCFKRRKIKQKRQNKTFKCNKISDKWFDKTLEEMKKEVLRTAKILNKYPNDPIYTGKYHTLRDNVHSHLRHAKRPMAVRGVGGWVGV